MARRAPSSLSKEAFAEAWRLLDVYIHEGRSYGYYRTEPYNGKWYDFVFEEHPPDSGINANHPGVTVYEVDAPPRGNVFGYAAVFGLIGGALFMASRK